MKSRADYRDLRKATTMALEKIITTIFIGVFSISRCWGLGGLDVKHGIWKLGIRTKL
jgi:hypothetical protein